MYKCLHQKHQIHTVDCNQRIVLREVSVDEFAVKLRMSNAEPPLKSFRGEAERYFQQLKGMRGFDIELHELVDNESRVTFIRGIAGMGKSVLVKQLTLKWANGELFRQFKVCITFECRELNHFAVNQGTDLSRDKLLHHFIATKLNFGIKNASDVLFIIDGLDELYDINTKDSIISHLLDIKLSKFFQSKIIITGRPHIENMLLRHGKSMGGLRKVEIHGLGEDQIDEYVGKFSSSVEHNAKIERAKDCLESNLQILHVPQILNSFCCVALLSKEHIVHNAAELYCWALYLLLKQHAEKDGPNDKRISEIFNEYSKEILKLSKICHDLLSKNEVVFEGDIELLFVDIGKELFGKGLFVDVSDNFSIKNQFKHLTLMEFFAAVYVCATENPREIICSILEKKLYQVLIFSCQLISGLMYDGIIRQMLKNTAKLKEVHCYRLVRRILRLVRECVNGYSDNVEEAFRRSLDVIMCLMNRDVINKHFILSLLKEFSFKNIGNRDFGSSSRKFISLMKLLICDFECVDFELRKAFQNVHFGLFKVNELNELKYAKSLASVHQIRVHGMGHMETTIRDIRKEVDKCANCKKVSVLECKLQNEDVEDEVSEGSKLEWLHIDSCRFNKMSFVNLCKWMITVSVEEFELWGIDDIKAEWWNVLTNAIVNAKEKEDEKFALKRLWILRCTVMDDEMRQRVIACLFPHLVV